MVPRTKKSQCENTMNIVWYYVYVIMQIKFSNLYYHAVKGLNWDQGSNGSQLNF